MVSKDQMAGAGGAGDLITALARDVEAARAAGDIVVLLALAADAVDQLEAMTADAPAALPVAQRISYNAAADAWPGWDADTPAPGAAQLQAARALAQRCVGLVDRLNLGAAPRGNAVWLVGAFDLALQHYPAAVTAFTQAAAFFAELPEMRLMAAGYAAIVTQITGRDDKDFAAALAALQALGTPDARAFIDQLTMARRVFAAA